MSLPPKDLFNQIVARLTKPYGKQEATSISRVLMEDLLHTSMQEVRFGKLIEYTADQLSLIDDALERLEKYEPVQHIIGFTYFFGAKVLVNKHTLIPRPETEELVSIVVEKHRSRSGLTVLDVGTGSGCIAVALAMHLPNAEVHAIDISEEALDTAAKNAANNNAHVVFRKLDVLSEAFDVNGLDIVISNPPYIRALEASQMHRNVLQFEPHTALFVSNEDPLVFYRVIAQKALLTLNPEGYLYFEINEFLGLETKTLVEEIGFENVELIHDMQGKQRFVVAQKLA